MNVGGIIDSPSMSFALRRVRPHLLKQIRLISDLSIYPEIHPELDPDMATMPTATRKPQRDLPLTEARAMMKSHFEKFSGADYGKGWADLWEKGDMLPWDRMVPSPALIDTLDNWQHVVGTSKLVLPDGSTRRKRALVPGCGRGVDVMLLQAYGYDVVGLEISPGAVEACEVYAKETENEEMYQDRGQGKGSRKFVHGDFYSDFQKDVGVDGFELIYDYTVSHPQVVTLLTCSSFVPCNHQ